MDKVLELGCGKKPYVAEKGEEVIHTDIKDFPYVSRRLNINKKFPFPKNSFDKVYASHVLEHSLDFDFTIKEIIKVLKPRGLLVVKVPYWTTSASHYPGHKTFFSYESFRDYLDFFEIVERKYCFWYETKKFKLGYKIMRKLFGKFPYMEDLFSCIPFKPNELFFVLKKINGVKIR